MLDPIPVGGVRGGALDAVRSLAELENEYDLEKAVVEGGDDRVIGLLQETGNHGRCVTEYPPHGAQTVGCERGDGRPG